MVRKIQQYKQKDERLEMNLRYWTVLIGGWEYEQGTEITALLKTAKLQAC